MAPRQLSENEEILFRALRDPSNRLLIPRIKDILRDQGHSDKDIMYYEMTGKHREDDFGNEIFDEMDDELSKLGEELEGEFSGFDTLRQHVQNMKKRRRSPLRFLIPALVLAMLIFVTVMLIATTISVKEVKSTPPAMTESAESSVSDGDKL